jgi:uronate dehydrogenase
MSTVLVTGAAGRIGHYLRVGLPGLGWELRLLDRVPIPEEPGSIVADVTDPAALRAAFADASAVVHLAGVIRTSSSFEEVLSSNIEGTYQVMEAARVAGVRRVIFASSNHANGFAPRRAPVSPGVADRPDSYYGVSKVFGEVLGRFYADRYGMQVACLRIGSCADRPTSPRMLGSWLSPADAVRLVDACLRSPDLDYSVVYGISRNTRRWWDLGAAEALGYQPQDDAEEFAAEVLAAYGGVDPGSPDEPQGGEAGRRVQSADR